MITANKSAGWQPAQGGPELTHPEENEREQDHLAGGCLPQPQAARPAADHTPTVLVVEDHLPTRLAMATWLAYEGFLVLTAADAHEAIGHLKRPPEPIDVAVLDVGLPDMDGITLCKKLRDMYPTMPVIVCSAHAGPAEVARLVELGACRYFRKPVEPDELLAAVEASLP